MATTKVLTPETSEEVQAALCSHARLLVRGAKTKPGLSAGAAGILPDAPEDTVELDMRRVTGIVEYEPGEFTFTARGGTALREIAEVLAAHGQYLPFDPPLVEEGATLGGTIAAGLSGSGRHRYGGVRDFLIGVRVVDGQGRLVRGGGKVVKNAAGFDLPKLMVGSLGRLGVIVEASFKVFPQPAQYATLRVPHPSLDAALATIARLNGSTFDIEALDLMIEEEQPVCYVRQGGFAATIAERRRELQAWLGAGEPLDEDATFWAAARSFAWAPPDWALVKTPVALNTIAVLDQVLAAGGACRRYIGGGAMAWIAWPGDMARLDSFLTQLQLGGLVIRGQTIWPFVGARTGASLAARVKRVLDPHNRLPTL